MIETFFYLTLLSFCVVAVFKPSHAMPLLFIIGFTQDSVRKLVFGEPIIFIVTVGFVFISIILGLLIRRGLTTIVNPFFKWNDKIRLPLILFLSILLIQFFHSLILYENLLVASIGMTTYLAPFVAVTVTYSLINNVEDITSLLRLYVIFGVIVSITVVMSFSGYDWQIFKEVGIGIKIYDQGTVLKSYAGIMRTGEVAAWHMAATACLITSLLVSSKRKLNIVLVVAILLLLMTAIVLTGRRKMLMVVVLFLCFYGMTLLYYRRRLSSKYFFSALLLAFIVWVGNELITLTDYSQSLGNYVARSVTVFGDASERLLQLGVKPIHWAYNRLGLFGGGLGIASQGGYLFGASDIAGGSGEGGLGKIMVELGLPGLIIVLWLIAVLMLHVNKCFKLAARFKIQSELLPLSVGLGVLLGVNVVTFSIATQVYGDVFVLILLGVFGGVLFAIPKLIASSIQVNSQFSHSVMQNKKTV